MLDDRKAAILAALVELYIETGLPVSSGAVLDRSGLAVSPATVRNELAVLERDGYAMQPHTSAGRIPTSIAYRYYVDHLVPDAARVATRQQISRFFGNVHTELSRLLKATSALLADMTHYPAVVLGPGLAADTVKGVHLVQLSGRAVLLVLVGVSGQVRQQVLSLDQAVGADDVDRAEQLLAAAARDGSQPDLAEHPPLVGALVERARRAIDSLEDTEREVYVGGTSTMAAAWEDIGEVHRVLEVLEREAMLLRVLAEARAGTFIRIGEEHPIGGDVSVIATPFSVGDNPTGAVGVIGPRRMDYRRTISVVEEVSEVLEGLLGS